MKRSALAIAFAALSVAVIDVSGAQPSGMGGMDMKDMDMMNNAQKGNAPPKAAQAKSHKGVGTVTAVDNAKGKVTIAHGPIPSMKWPAMSMTFDVKDKVLIQKLKKDQKVDFEFVEQGRDYVLTTAK